jgi:hypothetical protein
MRLILGLSLLAACATVQVDGFKLDEDVWRHDQKEVRSRASFELKCPGEQLELKVLASYGGLPDRAKQVGVSGCEHALVYVCSADGWILNSSDGVAK